MLHHNQEIRLEQVRKRSHMHLHQTIHFTRPDRYPEIFKKCASLNGKPQKIMSFGCSTGEECDTLRKYFPQAYICGIDVDHLCIKTANQKNVDAKIHYTLEMTSESDFDFIFCMSVFCRWPATYNLPNCGHLYKFSQFETDLLRLVDKLRVGGFLVLYNSNFKLVDTACAHLFEPIETEDQYGSGFVQKYDKSENICWERDPYCLYKKIKSWE